jgi:hypothetical protein
MDLFRSALVVSALTLVSLAPTAAHADKLVMTDASQDVVKYAPTGQTIQPTRAEGDIVRSVVQHKAKRVVMTLSFNELTPAGIGAFNVFTIKTRTMTRTVALQTIPGYWDGRTFFYKGVAGRAANCLGIHHQIDYTANTATVSVPRRCLHDPTWVKVAMQHNDSPTNSEMYMDDALVAGRVESHPVYGPKVRR